MVKTNLPVRNLLAETVGDPVSGLTDASLVAGRAEVATLAGEGQQVLVAAVGALETGESAGEIAAAVEFLDDVNGIGSKRSTGLAVGGFVFGEKLAPSAGKVFL